MRSGAESPLPAPSIALDTSAYSHLRRGHPTVIEWVASAEIVEVSTIVLGELEAGFQMGSRYRENHRVLADFLAEPFVRIRPVTAQVGARYGRIFAALRSAGTPIPINDIWIAAVTVGAASHLVTFDTDFARVEGLEHSLLA